VEASRLLARKLDLQVDSAPCRRCCTSNSIARACPTRSPICCATPSSTPKARIRVSAEVSLADPGACRRRRHRHPGGGARTGLLAFTRLDRSRDRSTGGYGLGLAIARLVLEQHGGTASAAESPLGGARFTLSWPLSQNVTES
jgi:hypothetical protein